MTPITWQVTIRGSNPYFWGAIASGKNTGRMYSHLSRKTTEAAKKDWIRFAKVNGIENWEFKDK